MLAVLALARGRLAWCAVAGVAAALASPVAAAFLIELTFLHGRAKLDVPVEALLQYQS